MNNFGRARLSVESLEARETPSGGVSGRITGVATDPTDTAVPTGSVTFTVDGAQPLGAGSGGARPLPVLLVIADRY